MEPRLNTKSPRAEVSIYQIESSAMGSRLAATDMCRKWGGGCAPLVEAELSLHLTQRGQGRGLPVCQVSS